MTEEAYEFTRPADLQASSLSVISEPVPVYTNIENGVGICAEYSVSQKVITIGVYPIEGFVYKTNIKSS
ncbi:MAG: DUF4249 family protein [Prolixibacteraceae bacterium]